MYVAAGVPPDSVVIDHDTVTSRPLATATGAPAWGIDCSVARPEPAPLAENAAEAIPIGSATKAADASNVATAARPRMGRVRTENPTASD